MFFVFQNSPDLCFVFPKRTLEFDIRKNSLWEYWGPSQVISVSCILGLTTSYIFWFGLDACSWAKIASILFKRKESYPLKKITQKTLVEDSFDFIFAIIT